MLAANLPATKIVLPWANAASPTYKTIPPAASSPTPGRASFNDGFPPPTFVDPGAGGIPPFGDDMNGALNVVTSWVRWMTAGGVIPYDSAFQTAIGGYPNGAIVASATTPGKFWRCLADNNGSNPDTGGGNWTPFPPAQTVPSGLLLGVQALANSSADIRPYILPGTNLIHVRMIGGGGAGGVAFAASPPNGSCASGGNAGSYLEGFYINNWTSAAVPLTIGAGGTSSAGVSGDGGDTVLGLTGGALTAPGGKAGRGAAVFTGPAVANQSQPNTQSTSVASGAMTLTKGVIGSPGFFLSNSISGVVGGNGASFGPWGVGGHAGVADTTGGDASGWGAGGAGAFVKNSATTQNGGRGTQGLCIIECYT
jgi:hypothetical protein